MENEIFKTKTLKWVKENIAKSYSISKKPKNSEMERKLIITKSFSNYGKLGYIFFALNGSPPKGCAIYQPEHRYIVFLNAFGKYQRKFNDVFIKLGEK